MLLGCLGGVALQQLLRKAPLALDRRRHWVRRTRWLLAKALLLILVCCPGVERVFFVWGLGSLRRPEGHRQRVVSQQFVGVLGGSAVFSAVKIANLRKRRGRRRRRFRVPTVGASAPRAFQAPAMVSTGMVVDLLTRVCALLLVFVPPQVPCSEQLLDSIAALIPVRTRGSPRSEL